jgi:hypothetical protein
MFDGVAHIGSDAVRLTERYVGFVVEKIRFYQDYHLIATWLCFWHKANNGLVNILITRTLAQ